MAEYQNYYDYNYHTDAKEDAAEVKKLRESLRKSFPPSIRKQIEQELEQDEELDAATVAQDVNQLTFSRLVSLFHEAPTSRIYTNSGGSGVWYTTPKQQPELIDATDVDFSE